MIEGGGINHLNGSFMVYDPDNIHINIGTATEIYDETGWEERLITALNDATIYNVEYYGKTLRIFYDLNRKYLDFVQVQHEQYIY